MLRGLNSKAAMIIGGVVFILLRMPIASFAGGDWELITQLPTERRGFAAAVVANRVYLIGGSLIKDVKRGLRDPGPFGISTVEEYDPQTNTWRPRADMPTPREYPKVAVVDGIIYVFGGSSGKDNKIENLKFPVRVEAYNPKTNRWIRKKDMPVSRINFGLGVVAGKVYLIGGATGFGGGHKQRMDRVDVYNPSADLWGTALNMPTRRGPGDVAVINNRLYVMGGAGWPPAGAGPHLKIIEEYDPISRQWQQKPDMLDLISRFSTVVVRDEIYLIGGFHPLIGPREYLATVDVYHPRTEAWDTIPELPSPLSPIDAAVVNGKIYVFGGYGEGITFVRDVLVYDTGFRAVEATGKMLTHWGKLKVEHQNQP